MKTAEEGNAEKLIRGLAIMIFMILSIVLEAVIVKNCWEWFVSDEFGIVKIDYLEALGILITVRVLIGGVWIEAFENTKERAEYEITSICKKLIMLGSAWMATQCV
jgi:hypothetical protein